jgi:ribosomal protein L16 Arg81 hydroxylase
MAGREHKNWRELCNAALDAKDPDELLKILQQLNKALKREEQVRRDFREAVRTNKSSGETRY